MKRFSTKLSAVILSVCLALNGAAIGSETAAVAAETDSPAKSENAKKADEKALPANATRITLYDKDTGELIPSELLEHHNWTFGTDIRFAEPDTPGGWIMTGPIYVVKANPQVYQTDLAELYRTADIFEFLCDDQPEVTVHDNGSMDLVFKTKLTVSGDVNGDGEFNIADAILLQKWLLGVPDTELARWEEADFCMDNKLNAADFSLMKRALMQSGDLPVSVSIKEESGGAVGWRIDYQVYREDGKCYLSYYDQTFDSEAQPVIVQIAESDYRAVMSQDYDSMMQNMTPPSEESETLYTLELSAADGSQNKAVSDKTPDVLSKLKALMKSYLAYVEPDTRVEYGSMFTVVSANLSLYLGPNQNYPAVTTIPPRKYLEELGYNEGVDDWLFTEYNGQYGWIRLYEDDQTTRTVAYPEMPAKPVIYLYPEEETDVHVELELTEADLRTTYPKYDNGWDVTAYPDGTLVNQADGSRHRYLFWDAENCSTRFDFSAGFCVAGSDTERFLKEKLTYMGLTEEEMNEFIVYWLPLMEHHAYNLIAFQGDAYTNSAKLTVTPAPDSECRIFMAYIPLEDAVEIAPQQLETFERTGFSVVEWGGVEIITKH